MLLVGGGAIVSRSTVRGVAIEIGISAASSRFLSRRGKSGEPAADFYRRFLTETRQKSLKFARARLAPRVLPQSNGSDGVNGLNSYLRVRKWYKILRYGVLPFPWFFRSDLGSSSCGLPSSRGATVSGK